MGRGQTARSAAAAVAASSVSGFPSVAKQPSSLAASQLASAARQPTMLNFGASLQQAAVSHLGMPLSFPASPRLRGQWGCEP